MHFRSQAATIAYVADPLRRHQKGEMAAYMIAEHKITDAAKFEEYRTKVGPMIAKHGGDI